MTDETVKIVVGAFVPIIMLALGHFYMIVRDMQKQIAWLIENCNQPERKE